ncbi:UNVERIFIED_CONTAM: hypothetical protein NY603_25730, partial [Bacteroidetes bacterium 56_B9]
HEHGRSQGISICTGQTGSQRNTDSSTQSSPEKHNLPVVWNLLCGLLAPPPRFVPNDRIDQSAQWYDSAPSCNTDADQRDENEQRLVFEST